MTKLSPAAQAVIFEYSKISYNSEIELSFLPLPWECEAVAAALRAAADQVVPEKPPQATYEYCCDYTQHREQDAIRSHFLAIATELENQ